MRAGTARMGQGHQIQIGRVHDPVKRQEGLARREGGGGRQDDEGRCNAAEAHPTGVFVEVAKDDRGSGRMALQSGADRIQLTPPRRPEQTEMDDDHPKRRWCVKVDDHRPARFVAGKVQPLKPTDMDVRARQKGVSMPSETDRVAADGQRLQTGQRADLVLGQSRRAISEAEVRLLQRDDIGLQGGDSGEHPFRVAAPVGTKALVDVPRGHAQAGL